MSNAVLAFTVAVEASVPPVNWCVVTDIVPFCTVPFD
jgi:hypothetical protein